jgi:hypothetical protein
MVRVGFDQPLFHSVLIDCSADIIFLDWNKYIYELIGIVSFMDYNLLSRIFKGW